MAASAFSLLPPPRRTGDDTRDLIQLFDYVHDLRDAIESASRGRTALTGPTTFYLDARNGKNTNSGETAALAWKDAQFSYEFLARNIDLARQQVTIECAAGEYSGVLAEGPILGQDTLKAVRYRGAVPEDVVFNDTIAFKAANGAAIALESLTVKGGWAVVGLISGYVAIRKNTRFDRSVSAHILAQYGGNVEILADYAIVGDALRHAWGYINGNVVSQGHIITLENDPVIAAGFVYATLNGTVQYTTPTFQGALGAGSRKFYYADGGRIDSGLTAGAVYPGDVAGVAGPGGGSIS